MSTQTIGEFIFALAFGEADPKPLDKAAKSGKEAAKEVKEAWQKTAQHVTSAFKTIGVAALGAGAGILALVDKSSAAADATAKAARAAGLASDEFQKLRFMAGRSGIEMTDLSANVRKLAFNMAEASRGGAQPFIVGLQTIGMSFEQLQGLKPTEQIEAIADALQGVQDPAERTAALMGIFGEDAGPKMASLLAGGSKGIREMAAEAERLGLVLDEATLTAAEAFQDQLGDAKAMIGAVTAEIGLALIPAVSQAIKQFRAWFEANRDLIKQRFSEFLEKIVPILMELAEFLAAVVKGAVDMTEAVGGVENAVKLMALAWAGFKTAQIVSGIVDITKALIAMKNAANAAKLARLGALSAPVAIGAAVAGAAYVGGEVTESYVMAQESAREAMERNTLRDAGYGSKEEFAEEASKRAEEFNAARDPEMELFFGLGAQVNADPEAAKALNSFVQSIKKTPMQKATDEKKASGGGTPRINTKRADELFGDELRRLAASSGVGAVGIRAALEAGASSLNEGAADNVAREAALGRLGSLAGRDFVKGSGTNGDPLLSEIFGEDVPDVALSSIARGAEPQVLISNITNNFTIKNNFDIDGAGDPTGVGDRVFRTFEEGFQRVLEQSTKTAKVRFAR